MDAPDANLRSTAIHEAGHAVASWALGLGIRYVSVEEDESSLGHLRGYSLTVHSDIEVTGRTRLRLEDKIVSLLAGGIAEELAGLEPFGCEVDHENALNCALYICAPDEESEKFLAWLDIRTRKLLEHPHRRAAHAALVEALLEQKRIKGTEAKALMNQAVLAFARGQERRDT